MIIINNFIVQWGHLNNLLLLSPGGSLSTRGVKGVKFRAGRRVSGRGCSGQVHEVIVVFTLGQLEREEFKRSKSH